MKLSVIIPHYNTYDYLKLILFNLLLQDREDIEIIVIDDSNDKRLDIYKDKFYHYTIIHNNKRVGVSKARNQGIKLSSGKYIAFIDSDDQISETYIKILIEEIKTNIDVITFNWIDLRTGKLYKSPKNYAVWKSIYKKDLIPLFNENLTHKEDVEFQEKLNEKAYTLKYINKTLYYYNSGREGSLYWEEKHNEIHNTHNT